MKNVAIDNKQGEERYERASVRWGVVAVHPVDLVEVYRELLLERQDHVTNTDGTRRSRTTALAHAAEAIAGLKSNGYKKGEIATILSILAND